MLAASGSDVPAAPVVALMAGGVVIGIMGHAARNAKVAGFGIAMVFAATALMVLIGFIAYEDDPSDPRECTVQAERAGDCAPERSRER